MQCFKFHPIWNKINSTEEITTSQSLSTFCRPKTWLFRKSYKDIIIIIWTGLTVCGGAEIARHGNAAPDQTELPEHMEHRDAASKIHPAHGISSTSVQTTSPGRRCAPPCDARHPARTASFVRRLEAVAYKRRRRAQPAALSTSTAEASSAVSSSRYAQLEDSVAATAAAASTSDDCC